MKKVFVIVLFIFKFTLFGNSIKVPNFQLLDLQKIEHSLDKYKNKLIVLIFWNKQCNYCKNLLDSINEIYYKHKDVVFLTFTNSDLNGINSLLEDKKYNFPVIKDDEIFNKYLIFNYPTTIILDKNNNIINYIEGEIKTEKLEKIINDNLE